MHARRRDARGPAGRAGDASTRSAPPGRGRVRGGDRPVGARPPGARPARPDQSIIGTDDRRARLPRASSPQRRSWPRWSHAGVGVRGFSVVAPEPGGPVRLAHRGGVRCQRLSWPPHRAGRRRPGARAPPVAATRLLRSELRLIAGPAPQPGRPARAGRGAGRSWPVAAKVSDSAGGGTRPGLPRVDHIQRALRGAGRHDRRDGAVPAAGRARCCPATPSPARPTMARCVTC